MRNLTIILLLSVSSVALCHAQMTTLHLPLEKQQTTDLSYNYGIEYEDSKTHWMNSATKVTSSTNFSIRSLLPSLILQGVGYGIIALNLIGKDSNSLFETTPLLIDSFFHFGVALFGVYQLSALHFSNDSIDDKKKKIKFLSRLFLVKGILSTVLTLPLLINPIMAILTGMSGLLSFSMSYSISNLSF